MDELQAMSSVPEVFQMRCLAMPDTNEPCYLVRESGMCYDVAARQWLEKTPPVARLLKEREIYQADIPLLLSCGILTQAQADMLTESGLVPSEVAPMVELASQIAKQRSMLEELMETIKTKSPPEPPLQPTGPSMIEQIVEGVHGEATPQDKAGSHPDDVWSAICAMTPRQLVMIRELLESASLEREAQVGSEPSPEIR